MRDACTPYSLTLSNYFSVISRGGRKVRGKHLESISARKIKSCTFLSTAVLMKLPDMATQSYSLPPIPKKPPFFLVNGLCAKVFTCPV
jgi:hypothetical protein